MGDLLLVIDKPALRPELVDIVAIDGVIIVGLSGSQQE